MCSEALPLRAPESLLKPYRGRIRTSASGSLNIIRNIWHKAVCTFFKKRFVLFFSACVCERENAGASRGIRSPELGLQAIVSLSHVGAENQTQASLQEQPVP